MNNILKLLAAVFVCALVISCQKKFLDPVNSVTRLSEFHLIDIWAPTPDTTIYHYITYDTLGRVKTINIYMDSPSPHFLFSIATYYYMDGDTLAYKKTEKYPDFSGGYMLQTFYYYYDNLQRLIKDSINYTNRVEINQYRYLNTMIAGLKTTVQNIAPPYINMESDTGFVGGTGDVIKLSSWPGQGNSENRVIEFIYDNKPNPFYQLNIRSTYRPLFNANDIMLMIDFCLQKNNLVHIAETFPAVPSAVLNTAYTYSYNTSGFPGSQYISLVRDSTEYGMISFVYK